MKNKKLIWRKATDKEMENGLDHSVNKGMFLVGEEEYEVFDEIETDPNLTEEDIENRINN